MDDITLSLSGESPSTPDNPALVAANQEYARMLSDATHQHYAGFRRNDPVAIAYADNLYRKAFPQFPPSGTPADPTPLHEQDTTSLEDRVAQIEVETMLRQTLGDSYESDMSDMRIGAQHLFATPEGVKILETLSPLITDLGPLAQVRGIRFLAELGQLVKQQGGR